MAQSPIWGHPLVDCQWTVTLDVEPPDIPQFPPLSTRTVENGPGPQLSSQTDHGDSLPLDSVQTLPIPCNVAEGGRNSLQDSAPRGVDYGRHRPMRGQVGMIIIVNNTHT